MQKINESAPLNALLIALLIEDNPDDKEFLEFHLRRVKRKAIRLECYGRLSTGSARLANGGIDIIFLDLSLPDSSGMATLTTIRKLAPEIPIVVLTGNDDDDFALRALKAGAQDYLVKGQLEPSSLGRSIDYAIERQHAAKLSQWLEAVVEGSNEAIIGKSLNNIIIGWNSGAERMYGFQADEILGQSFDVLVPPDCTDDSALNVERIKRGEKVDPYEARRRTKDGRDIIVYMSESAIRDSAGTVTGVSVIGHDITQQKLTEERLKLSVSASKIGLWDWDLQTNKMQWDVGMYRLFGVTDRQFSPSFEAFLECVHAKDRQRVKEKVEAAHHLGGEFDFDFCALLPEDKIAYMESKGQTFCDQQGKPVRMTGACFDTTDRTLALSALQESDQRLRLALESAKMGVWDWDLTTDRVWRSLKHDEIFGYDSMLPEWTYQMFLTHVVPDDRAGVQERIDRALDHGDYDMQCRIIHAKNQAVRWISAHGETVRNEQGKSIRMLGAVTDITEAKHLEQVALEVRKHREQITNAIVQHAPIGIVILDSDLRITNANDVFVRMMHRSLEQLLHQPLADVLPEEVRESALEFASSGKQVRVSRLQVAVPNELSILQRHWDLSLWPVSDDHGQVAGGVMQVVDCTDIVQLAQQREDFVASIAHDIKNPLIGAERLFSVLCDPARVTSPETHANMLSVLRDGNSNLLSLVQNLVDVYRYEALNYTCHYEHVDLKVLIGSCIKQMADFAERHDVILHNRVIDSVTIQADAIGLRRVFMNLLHNAIKFNRPAGTVEIATEVLDDAVAVRIVDTGHGISESEQKELFRRFTQGAGGKRFSTGTGLGLFLCKQIIEGHKGTITCQSQLDSGTTFLFTLPLADVSNGN